MTPDRVTFTHERSYAYGSKTIHRSLRCLSTKMSRPLSYAALADDGLSAGKSFGGFSQTLSALLQFRMGPDQRRGCAALAAS